MSANRINLSSPTANMFGIEPCPQCGSQFRYPLLAAIKGREAIQCDDCGLEETEAWGFCTVCHHAHYVKGCGPACPTCDCVENEPVPA